MYYIKHYGGLNGLKKLLYLLECSYIMSWPQGVGGGDQCFQREKHSDGTSLQAIVYHR